MTGGIGDVGYRSDVEWNSCGHSPSSDANIIYTGTLYYITTQGNSFRDDPTSSYGNPLRVLQIQCGIIL